MTANNLTNYILTFLTEEGWRVWRANAGYSGRHNVKLSPPGTPDIIGYSPRGRFVGIEVKVGEDKLRDSQIDFLHDLMSTPLGISTVARSSEGFMDWYRRGKTEGFPARRLAMYRVRPAWDPRRSPDTTDEDVPQDVWEEGDPPPL